MLAGWRSCSFGWPCADDEPGPSGCVRPLLPQVDGPARHDVAHRALRALLSHNPELWGICLDKAYDQHANIANGYFQVGCCRRAGMWWACTYLSGCPFGKPTTPRAARRLSPQHRAGLLLVRTGRGAEGPLPLLQWPGGGFRARAYCPMRPTCTMVLALAHMPPPSTPSSTITTKRR